MGKAHLYAESIGGLPDQIPVFPLDNALLLPGEMLPLNVFEGRYIHMVLDAMKEQRLIGIVRPDSKDGLCQIGCVGRVVGFEETPDNRLQILLRGMSRFVLGNELPQLRGYRRFSVDWQPFASDIKQRESVLLDGAEILQAFSPYLNSLQIKADWSILENMSGTKLINFLSCNLPLKPSEKQSLLEANSVETRLELLTAVTEISLKEKEGTVTRH